MSYLPDTGSQLYSERALFWGEAVPYRVGICYDGKDSDPLPLNILSSCGIDALALGINLGFKVLAALLLHLFLPSKPRE